MRSRILNIVALLLLGAVAIAIAASAEAQERPTWLFSAGWFPTSFSTSARLSSNQVPGTDVDLEDDLGFDTSASNLRFEGFWRFKPRHRMEFGYTSWRRSAENSIDKQIQWGDKLFDVGADVKAVNNAQFIKLAYRYSFYQSDRTEIDASIGFDTVWNKFSLEGEATITGEDGTEETGVYEERKDFIAPAPVLGLSITTYARENIVLRGSAEYFQATYNETTGKILDVRGSGDYLFTPSWGMGLGYTWVGYKVERPRFDAQYDFSGPLLYFTYRR